MVRHVVEGRTFIYFPKKWSDRTIRELAGRFVDRVFDRGQLDRVMVALLDSKPPTSRRFDRLRAMIDEAAAVAGESGPPGGRGSDRSLLTAIDTLRHAQLDVPLPRTRNGLCEQGLFWSF